MNLLDFEDPILQERNNNKPLYVNRYLVKEFLMFCKDENKNPQSVAEYLIKLGLHSVKNYKNQKVSFDIKSL